MMRLARSARLTGRWSVTLRRGDATPLPPGAPFLLPTYQDGIRRASPSAPCHVLFESAADPTRRYEMHNGIQWLGRSGATHECDVSVLPETVAGQLRSPGGRPQGLPIAMFECKDKPKAANVDELRQTLARMFDLALVTLPAPGLRCRIYEAVTPRGWGNHRKTYIDFFASGAFGQVRAGGFSTGSISLGVHYRIARMGDIYTNPGSLRLGTVRFVEALDNAHL